MDRSQNADTPSYSKELLPSVNVEPVLITSPVIEKGWISCSVCLIGSTNKNYKRAGLEKVNKESFNKKALEWVKYDHVYNSIHDRIDWTSTSQL